MRGKWLVQSQTSMVAPLKFGISNLIPHIIMDVIITYPCWYLSQFMLVKEVTDLKDGSAWSTHNDTQWWRHQMETFSALLAIFPAQRPVTQSSDVFFDQRLNKRLSKQSWGRWFEMLSRPLWRHCNGKYGFYKKKIYVVYSCCLLWLFVDIANDLFSHHYNLEY